MNQNIYRIEVRDSSNNLLADISDICINRNLLWVRNRASQIRLSLDITSLNQLLVNLNITLNDLFIINSSEVWIYRNNVLIISGQINWKSLSEDSNISIIDIEACGWLDILSQRYTPAGTLITYSAQDVGNIMWDLIDDTQTDGTYGDIGITQGTIEASKNIDRTYLNKNIREAIIQLSEIIDGPDFEITANKVFNTYYPKQGDRRLDTVFTYPGNIRSIKYESDGKNMANRVIAVGSGNGNNALNITVNSADSAKEQYKLRTSVLNLADISTLAVLTDHANEELRARTNPIILPTITLDAYNLTPFIDYNLGDEIEIKILSNISVWAEMAGLVRIEAINIDVDDNNIEKIKLETVII